MLALANGSGN